MTDPDQDNAGGVLQLDETGNRNASDNDHTQEQKRGCKRRLDTAERENGTKRALDNSVTDNEQAIESNTKTVGDCDTPGKNTSERCNNNNSVRISEEETAPLKASASTIIDTGNTMNTASGGTLDLPQGMRLEWNAQKTRATLHVLETMDASNKIGAFDSTTEENREFRVCLVGRAKISVEEGSVEILGYTISHDAKDDREREEETPVDTKDNDCGSECSRTTMAKGQEIVVTSPFWSSWMTIEANHAHLPCRITLDCIRGPESFQVMSPKRPIVIPPNWRNCADDLVRDYRKRCRSASGSRKNHSAVLMDSLEDYEQGKRVNRKRRSNRHDHDHEHDHHYDRNNDENRMVCMITGGKGVGKSTLLRYMTNRLLSSGRNFPRTDDGENGSDTVTSHDDESDYDMHNVAVLDTDVGQPELAPPGLLRLSIVRKPLLQPPYWNLVPDDATITENLNNDTNNSGDERQPLNTSCYGPQQPQPQQNPTAGDDHDDSDNDNHSDYYDDGDGVKVVSSVFFGATSSKVDPTRFMNAVHFLIQKYETEVVPSHGYGMGRPIPLLINMDGWVKGMGYQILTALVESLHPTHLVQILGETRAQTFDLSATIQQLQQDSEMTTDSSPSPSPPFPREPPKFYQLPACQNLPGASLCRIPAFTTRNFRWATYFLPHQLQTFDAWDFASAKSLQTGWILATNSDKTATVPRWWDEDGGDESDNDNDNDNDGDEIHNEGKATSGPEKPSNTGALNDECRLARALAKERPYCVPMEAVDAFVLGSDFEDYLRLPHNDAFGAAAAPIHDEPDEDGLAAMERQQTRARIFQALNGSIVALCTDDSSMESLGYGILRSIDWDRRLLYVLVPPSVPSSSLSKVGALVGGNLPLPLALLYRGVYAESFPYLTALSEHPGPVILGSEPMKSRNNIARRGLAAATATANADRTAY